MNIFILSWNVRRCAKYYFNLHVHKIISEIAQMMSTAIRLLLNADLYDTTRICKSSHANHPVSIWLRSSDGNWNWTMDLVDELHKEWKYRYGHPESRLHASYVKILYIRKLIKRNHISFGPDEMTPFALAMPDEYKSDDAVDSYRKYYMYDEHKRSLAKWKRRSEPHWWK